MRVVVASGGVAGLATALAVARADHEAVVLERDRVDPQNSPKSAFAAARNGIPHFEDVELHDRIETIFARLMRDPPPPVGPPRDELLARLGVADVSVR